MIENYDKVDVEDFWSYIISLYILTTVEENFPASSAKIFYHSKLTMILTPSTFNILTLFIASEPLLTVFYKYEATKLKNSSKFHSWL